MEEGGAGVREGCADGPHGGCRRGVGCGPNGPQCREGAGPQVRLRVVEQHHLLLFVPLLYVSPVEYDLI